MTYAAILTHVQADSDTAPRLACAIEMAERFGAVIIGVGVEMIPPVALDSGFYAVQTDWAGVMRDAVDERLKAARKTFTTASRELGARAIWCSGVELPVPALAAASRSADLIVAGGQPHRRLDSHRDAPVAELAMTAGRPVLVAPSHGRELEAKRIVLAWKDAREARRAQLDALPFLTQADAVLVIEVCGKDDADQAQIRTDDVAASLRRHGAKAESKVVVGAHHSAAQQILVEAEEAGADLIVAGAYGHSRMGEWVFGGFTYDLLSQDERYLLLSH
jgi:nucleotide-binding universal stress UspA family protein